MSPKRVSKTEFKAKLTEYLHKFQSSGVKLIVTDHGIPALEVRSFSGDVRQPLEVLRGTVVRYENPLCPVGNGDW